MATVPVPEIMIPSEQLRSRVAELGAEIAAHYGDSRPILVCVLKGASVFLADLVRAMPIDLECDFMAISSYGGGESSGIVRIVKDIEIEITERDVLIVEDIVDTGLTLNYLRRSLTARAPRSLATVTLLDKAVRRIVPVQVEWRGFEIPDVYVLGYGMDHDGIYRNVKDLVVADDITQLAAQPSMYVPALFPSELPAG
jgi:hypoxanthine phosphoribosyltransferase